MATNKHSSKYQKKSVNLTKRLQGAVRELTAIHAHTDALALAVEAEGNFRDGELATALFDLEERLLRVLNNIEALPASRCAS